MKFTVDNGPQLKTKLIIHTMTCGVKLIIYYDMVQKHAEQRLAEMVAGPLLAQAAGQAHASEHQRCPSSNGQQLYR